MGRSLWLMITVALVVASILSGSTLALLSAHNSHPDGNMVTSDLCLNAYRVENGVEAAGPIFYVTTNSAQEKRPTGVWAPGDSQTRTLRIKNGDTCNKSVDVWVESVSANLQSESPKPSPADATSLVDQLRVAVWALDPGGQRVQVAESSLRELLATPIPLRYPGELRLPLSQGSYRDLEFIVAFGQEADNAYQGRTSVIQFAVLAIQQETVPPKAGGRMTGGGSVFTTDGNRVTHGFELYCDVAAGPNNLEINWGNGERFHLDVMTEAACETTSTGANRVDIHRGKGTGWYNGPGATAEWIFTDAGEPGTRDRATITIRDARNRVVLTVSGYLDRGNHQYHAR